MKKVAFTSAHHEECCYS